MDPFLLPFLEDEDRDVAVANRDPANWRVHDSTAWKKADVPWQEFYKRWRGATMWPTGIGHDNGTMLPPNEDLPIIVRDAYVSEFNRVYSWGLFSPRRGVLITGQPGVGKTMFQYYLLARLLQQEQVVLFSEDGVKLFLFYHDGVYELPADSSCLPMPKVPGRVFLWSLFDIQPAEPPPPVLLENWCFPVQTASPDQRRYRRWVKHRSAWPSGLPLWTREELEKGLRYQRAYDDLLNALATYSPQQHSTDDTTAGALQAPAPQATTAGPAATSQLPATPQPPATTQPSASPDPLMKFGGTRALLDNCHDLFAHEDDTVEEQLDAAPDDDKVKGQLDVVATLVDRLLQEAIDRFGYAARDVFNGVFEWDLTTTRHMASMKNTDFPQLSRIVSSFAVYGFPDPRLAHSIIAITPIRSTSEYVDKWSLDFKSPWIAMEFVKRLDAAEDDVIRAEISRFSKIPAAKAMAGWLLEPFFHRALMKDLEGERSWRLVQMEDNKHEPPTFTFDPASSATVSTVSLPAIRRELVNFPSENSLSTSFQPNRYYRPEKSNFPLIDAFTVEFDEQQRTAVLWLIQITGSRKHGGSGAAYRAIRKIIIALKAQLKNQQPARKRTKIAESASGGTSSPVTVRWVLVVPEDKNTTERLQWHFPQEWAKNCTMNDHRGHVYRLAIPLALSVPSGAHAVGDVAEQVC